MRDQTSTPWGNLRIRLLPIDSERIRPEKQKMSPQARSLTRSDLTASRALNSPASNMTRFEIESTVEQIALAVARKYGLMEAAEQITLASELYYELGMDELDIV